MTTPGGAHGPAGIPADAPHAGTWAPLAVPVFRSLWIAQLASNMGTWMQSVGVQWLLVKGPNAAVLTAAAQAASLLPVLVVSLPAGVLADVLDRRRYLIGVQTAMVLVAGLLALLTAVGQTDPALLLVLTFVLGIGAALGGPAWQAVQPELVPRALIPESAALGSMNVNIARAVGPALAGVIVAAVGPAVVFGLNALSFLGVVGALLRWRRPHESAAGREALVPALRAGARYLRSAPGARRILLRSALFVVPASALWALLAVVANRSLGLGAGGYGLLLGALGLGAVIGALILGVLRRRLGRNALMAVFTAVYGVGMFAAAVVPSAAVVAVLLVAAGTGWLVMLSTFNTALQLTLPAWVRARGLAGYLVVFMGGQGLGALVWGLVGQVVGIRVALLAATALLLLGGLSLLWWPLLPATGTLDRDVRQVWAEPEVAAPVPDGAGPIVVEIEYRVRADEVAAFLAAADALGVSRRRTGATSWHVYRDVADPERYVEVFTVPTWGEHLRQHRERLTGYDVTLQERVHELDEAEPVVRHLVPGGTDPEG